MLNQMQASIDRSIRKGKSVVWVTRRQTGKTHIGHEVARGFGSTAYVTCNYQMINNHKRSYEVHNLQYFDAQARYLFYGGGLSGFQLIVIDNFEWMPLYALQRVLDELPKRVQTLWMATRWGNFMTTPPVDYMLRTKDDDLNTLMLALHDHKSDILID